MRSLPTFIVAALFVSATAAHADTFTTFTLNSAFNAPTSTGGTITGTLTYDNTTSQFSAVNLLTAGFPNANGSNGQPLTGIYYQGADPTGFYAVLAGNATGAGLQLDLPITNFNNVSSTGICTTASNQATCFNSVYGNTGFSYAAVSGTLTSSTPVAPTPEPSSLALLGTGALGIAGALRRRLR